MFFLLDHTEIPIDIYKRSVVRHLVNAARACILSCWRQPGPPTLPQWLGRVKEIYRMETLTGSFKGKMVLVEATWLKWKEFQGQQEYIDLVATER